MQANSVQCTLCIKKTRVHKQCSGARGDLSRVAHDFRCDGTIQ